MDHKFCIVAAGDYPNTGKYVEAIIFASRGGCVPVFIGVSPRSLAFGSVIDYRRVALWSGVSSLGSNLDLWRRWSAEQVRPMTTLERWASSSTTTLKAQSKRCGRCAGESE